MTWWSPGQDEGWLSRRWVQVIVVALPNLPPKQIEASLKYKVQTLLPTPELAFSTRWFRYQGKTYGVAVINRFGEPAPRGKKVLVGVSLQLPRTWPGRCRVAVATPDGWEIHWYDQHVLAQSYPPFSTDSKLVFRYLEEHSEDPVFWLNPGALPIQPPEWATSAPAWPSNRAWGFSWTVAAEPRWPWWVGGVFFATSMALVALGLGELFDSKQRRNQEWKQWVDQVTILDGQSVVSAQRIQALQERSGVAFFEVMDGLHRAWSDQVEIQKISITGTTLSLTARASSALSASDLLDKASVPFRFRVVEIRQRPVGEEFDLEGVFLR